LAQGPGGAFATLSIQARISGTPPHGARLSRPWEPATSFGVGSLLEEGALASGAGSGAGSSLEAADSSDWLLTVDVAARFRSLARAAALLAPPEEREDRVELATGFGGAGTGGAVTICCLWAGGFFAVR